METVKCGKGTLQKKSSLTLIELAILRTKHLPTGQGIHFVPGEYGVRNELSSRTDGFMQVAPYYMCTCYCKLVGLLRQQDLAPHRSI